MAVTQQQVSEWFAKNPTATGDEVAAAVKSVGGLEANAGLAGMIANRYGTSEAGVNQYYNNYISPTGGLGAVDSTTGQTGQAQTLNTVADQTTTGGLPTTNTLSLPATNTISNDSTTNVIQPPTLISADGKSYAGDSLLKLVQQLGATTTVNDLKGTAYGVKEGNIGFDYTEADKLFGTSNATQQVFLDAARNLLDLGITDLSQLKAEDVRGSGTVYTDQDTGKTYVSYPDPNNPEVAITREVTGAELDKIITKNIDAEGENPATTQRILNDIATGRAVVGKDGKVYSQGDSMDLGTTYTGPGGTSYTLKFDADGSNNVRTQSNGGHSTFWSYDGSSGCKFSFSIDF